jgi:hypothetical protein
MMARNLSGYVGTQLRLFASLRTVYPFAFITSLKLPSLHFYYLPNYPYYINRTDVVMFDGNRWYTAGGIRLLLNNPKGQRWLQHPLHINKSVVGAQLPKPSHSLT